MGSSRKNYGSTAVTAVLYMAVGVLFFIFRSGMLNVPMTVAGVAFIVAGIVSLVNKALISGVFYMIIGALVLLCGWLFVEVVLLVFGVLLFARGLLDLVASFKVNSAFALIASALTIVAGVMLVVSKWAMLDWIFVVLGVLFFADGVMALFGKKR